jgi:uncharacterized protein (TIGR00369 family)
MMPMRHEAHDPNFADRVRQSFARQQLMHTIGATLTKVEAGIVEISIRNRQDLTQQHGFMHAGVVAAILDSACGYAAFTLMPADSAVLSIEFKVNLLAPAKGEQVIARASVKRSGRNITVCTADAYAVEEGKHKLVATMMGTMMCLSGRSDLLG